MIDTDKFTFDLSKLRLLETEMQVTIWKHEKSGTPQIIIDVSPFTNPCLVFEKVKINEINA